MSGRITEYRAKDKRGRRYRVDYMPMAHAWTTSDYYRLWITARWHVSIWRSMNYNVRIVDQRR
jgi:hypothetical protein